MFHPGKSFPRSRVRHGDDAQHFIEAGVAELDLFPAALAQGAHAVLAGAVGEAARALALQHQLVHLVVESENFKDTDAAAVAGAPATVAADRRFQHFDELAISQLLGNERREGWDWIINEMIVKFHRINSSVNFHFRFTRHGFEISDLFLEFKRSVLKWRLRRFHKISSFVEKTFIF